MAQNNGSVLDEPKWVRFVAGGAGSCTAEICTLWIDTVKVRLQIAGTHGATGPKMGAFATLKSIVNTEGVRGLYKGLTPALLRQAYVTSVPGDNG
jgi:hypothetical protein